MILNSTLRKCWFKTTLEMARNASVSSIDLQDIDIMSDSLSLLGEDPASFHDDGLVKYGDLVLNIAPKASHFYTLPNMRAAQSTHY